MKTTLKFMILSLMAIAFLTTSSCAKDGEDGAIGPQGIQGEQGTSGASGSEGLAGENGNANVIATNWVSLNFTASWDGNGEASFEILDENITQEVIDSYALLGYVKFSSSDTSASSIPFVSLGQQYEINHAMLVGKYKVHALVNDMVARPEPPTNHEVRYILIAPSNLTGKRNTTTLEKMQKDGIDPNNYQEVMDYLGLTY